MDVGSLSCGYFQIKLPYYKDWWVYQNNYISKLNIVVVNLGKSLENPLKPLGRDVLMTTIVQLNVSMPISNAILPNAQESENVNAWLVSTMEDHLVASMC